jgi:hypothetical protein
MSDDANGDRPLVIHITAAQDHSAASVLRDLTAAGLHIESYGDVYRALAALARSRPKAVVVCMDDVGRRELDFFPLAARLHPSAPIYVYGGSRSKTRVSRAIELGATGTLDARSIQSITVTGVTPGGRTAVKPVQQRPQAMSPRAEQIDEPDRADESTITAPQNEWQDTDEDFGGESPRVFLPAEGAPTKVSPDVVAYRQGSENEREPAEMPERPVEDAMTQRPSPPPASKEDRVVEEEEDTQPDQSVRVPWLRYDDQIVRRRPPDSNRPPAKRGRGKAAPSPETSKRKHVGEPLLSREELEALMGDDDVASIAPPDPKREGMNDDAGH